MPTKTFRSKHVEKAYNDNDEKGCLALLEHCQASRTPCTAFADDEGTADQMKRPDLLIAGKPAEVQVSSGWHTRRRPSRSQWPYGIMIFGRKMHQVQYKGGAWWIINSPCTHALVLPFSAKPIGDGFYCDEERKSRDPVVYFSMEDATLVKLGKVDTSRN